MWVCGGKLGLVFLPAFPSLFAAIMRSHPHELRTEGSQLAAGWWWLGARPPRAPSFVPSVLLLAAAAAAAAAVAGAKAGPGTPRLAPFLFPFCMCREVLLLLRDAGVRPAGAGRSVTVAVPRARERMCRGQSEARFRTSDSSGH